MNYKQYLLCLFTLLCFSACKSNKPTNESEMLNMSEEKEGALQRPEGSVTQVDKIIADVDMNDKQAEKFRTIFYHYQDRRLAIREKGGKPQQLLKEVLKMRDEQNRKVEKFLNDEQYERYLIAINDKKGRPIRKKVEAPKM